MIQRFLEAPRLAPPLDSQFRPAPLARRSFAHEAEVPVHLVLEQSPDTYFRYDTRILAESHPDAPDANFYFLERLAKTLLWLLGGWRFWFDGPPALAAALERHFRQSGTGRFDSEMLGQRVFDHPITVVHTNDVPSPRARSERLGRHLNGCRIGFDLGGSDRKVAAVQEGRVVFSEETVWDPYFQPDPQYHFDGIMDSLRRAAAHLPRVDCIGGSAAGIYVDNRVRLASLFRGVPAEQFEARAKDLFLELRREWNNIPFDVINDGEVTALAGSMALGENGVYGIALGTSTAGGYVDLDGNLTSALNEPAFAPLDYRTDAPLDEWSGDRGCGALYLSQQAVGRLLSTAGIKVAPELPLPEKLKQVQQRMATGDERATAIYQTVGVYLGHAIANLADFQVIRHVLVLGRVTSGPGGAVMVDYAKKVLEVEFPELAGQIRLHLPDETAKRHGQAIAAASLPTIAAPAAENQGKP